MSELLKINTLYITNFKSHVKTILEMKDLTIIYGFKNGTGKSTIADAICFLLNGKTIQKNKGHSLIQYGKEKAKISALCDYNGECYLKREIDKGIDYTFMIDSHSYPKDLAKYHFEQVVTLAQFENLIYINGHHIFNLMNMTPLNKTKTIDEMLGIDVIYEMITLLSRNKFSEEKITLTKKLEELKKKKTETETKLESSDQFLEKLKNEQKKLEEKREKLIKTIGTYSEEKPKDKIVSIQDKLTKINDLQKSLIPKNLEIETHQLKLEQIQKQQIQEKQKIHEIKKNLKIYHKFPLEEIGNTIIKIKSEINQLQKQKEKYNHEIQLNIKVNEILSLLEKEKHDTCPLCHNHLETLLKRDTLDVKQKSPDLIQKLKLKTKKYDDLNAYKSEIIEIKNILTLNQEKYNKHKQKFQQLTQEKNHILKIITSIKGKLSENIEEKIEKFNEIEIKLNQLKTNIYLYENETHENVHELSEQIEQTKEELRKISKKEIKNEILLKSFQILLKKTRQLLLEKINPVIESILKTIYDDYQLKYHLYLENTAYGDRYSESITFFNKVIEYENLSDGQKALCALALIISISELSNDNLSLLIFDEIQTSGIDNDAMENMLGFISQLPTDIRVLFIDRNKQVIRSLLQKAEEKDYSRIIYELTMNKDGITDCKSRLFF